jgi:hypothetical protein
MFLGRAIPFLCSVKIFKSMVNRCLIEMLPSGLLPHAANTTSRALRMNGAVALGFRRTIMNGFPLVLFA